VCLAAPRRGVVEPDSKNEPLTDDDTVSEATSFSPVTTTATSSVMPPSLSRLLTAPIRSVEDLEAFLQQRSRNSDSILEEVAIGEGTDTQRGVEFDCGAER
jgi:hypothetical protein